QRSVYADAARIVGSRAGDDRGARSAISGATQLIVGDAGRRWKCIADFADTDPNRPALDNTLGQRPLLVEIQSVDPYIAGRRRTETPYLTRAVHADRFQSQRQAKRILRGNDGVVGCVLSARSGCVGNHGHADNGDRKSSARPVDLQFATLPKACLTSV